MMLVKNALPYSFVDQLQPHEFSHIESIANSFKFCKGEYIFQADQSDHSVYILLTGCVKITRISQLGNELIQWFCMPGDIFGISGENHLSNNIYAKALTETRVLKIKKNTFNQLLLDQPRIGLLVIEKLSSRIHVLGDMVLYMASDNANERFIKLLQHLSIKYGRPLSSGVYIDIPTTHQDFADMIGSCRQTVSGIISGLKREGVLSVSRKGINIYQPGKLMAQVQH